MNLRERIRKAKHGTQELFDLVEEWFDADGDLGILDDLLSEKDGKIVESPRNRRNFAFWRKAAGKPNPAYLLWPEKDALKPKSTRNGKLGGAAVLYPVHRMSRLEAESCPDY